MPSPIGAAIRVPNMDLLANLLPVDIFFVFSNRLLRRKSPFTLPDQQLMKVRALARGCQLSKEGGLKGAG